MPKENPPELIRPNWFGAIATTAIASIINFVILPMWFTLILSFGKSDIDPGNGIFAACDANTISCSGPDIGFISLVVVTLIALAAGAAKLGQILGRTSRHRKVFFQFWVLAAVVMALEAWIFIF